MGNEMGERKYWEGGREESVGYVGGGGTETWEHMWEGCRDWGMDRGESWQEACRWVLGVEGEGEG